MAPTWHTDRMVIVGDAAHKVGKPTIVRVVPLGTDIFPQSTPNAAMGANQAIESSAVLVNKLQTVWSDSADVVPSTTVAAALKGYAELRKPRTAMVVQKASVSCRAQLGHGGLARAVRHELPSLTDGDWLFRGFMGFSGAPVLAALPLSPRGEFYQRAVDQFQQRSESKGVSRSELFGIED